MKQIFTLMLGVGLSTFMFGQTVTHTITQLGQRVDTANCDDAPIYQNDTVTVVGYVMTAGNLGELASGSTTGANGIRPFIFINDTANGGAIAPQSGIQVMGVNWQTTTATSGVTSLLQGDIIKVTGVLDYYNGATQIAPLSSTSLSIVGTQTNIPSAISLPVSTLNGANSVQNMGTGEVYEGTFVELNNVVVTSVNQSGSGSSARVSFTVADANGNSITVYDKFLAQKLSSWTALNPNSPATTGSFTPPSVGSYYTSIKGIVDHYDGTSNCTGGYQLDPFDASHYVLGQSFPAITNLMATPVVPTSSDSITISAEISDVDGTISGANIYYSTSATALPSAYPSYAMVNTTGNTYEYKIAPQADGSIVYYYIEAIDNNNNTTMSPSTTTNGEPDFNVVYVRDNGLSIVDVQKPLNSSGDSPFEGQVVTISGYVTATADTCDLGFVYIQDSAATEYAGIYVTGSLLLPTLTRNQHVEITGTVEENYGFTRISVSSVTPGTTDFEVQPVVIDPSDSLSYVDVEKYESMLVKYADPSGGKLYVTEGDAGFGEYKISNVQGNTSEFNSRRLMGGRYAEGSAQSSLAFQLVSDTYYETNDGNMIFPAIQADSTHTMDAVTGIIYYAFSTYKLTPRNNSDVENLNVALDTTCSAPTMSIAEGNISSAAVTVYPNPARNIINISHVGVNSIKATLYSVNGQPVKTANVNGSQILTMDLSSVNNGFYLLHVADENGQTLETKKVIIRK